MAGEEDGNPKAWLRVNLGSETDAAFGEVIRGLLKRPAEEAGNLLADGIGLLGDRVRQKRLHNTWMGLESTRSMLEAKNVRLKDITPPEEEEMQILLEGMSLAGDDRIRNLWSGLLSSALDPDGVHSIERPLTSAISSMTPADAKIIEYVAYVVRMKSSIERDARTAAGVADNRLMSLGDSTRVAEKRAEMSAKLESFLKEAEQLEEKFELRKITANEDWPDNLARLGILRAIPNSFARNRRPPSVRGLSVSADDLSDLVSYVKERIQDTEELALDGAKFEFLSKHQRHVQNISLGVEFTRFGEKLCAACGLL